MITIETVDPTFITINIVNIGPVVVNHYEVRWERDTSGVCPEVDEGTATITGSSNSYTITGLEEDSRYYITVTAVTMFGSISNQIITHTGDSREYYYILV